jgi:hypothetical protein
LGIKRIYRLKNQRIDGKLELDDGLIVAFEIKLRMNWLKACQSGYQFTQFLKITGGSKSPVNAGIVFFEQFSGDWARAKSRPIQPGWIFWYLTHHQISGLGFHLVQFRDGEIKTYSDLQSGGAEQIAEAHCRPLT